MIVRQIWVGLKFWYRKREMINYTQVCSCVWHQHSDLNSNVSNANVNDKKCALVILIINPPFKTSWEVSWMNQRSYCWRSFCHYKNKHIWHLRDGSLKWTMHNICFQHIAMCDYFLDWISEVPWFRQKWMWIHVILYHYMSNE